MSIEALWTVTFTSNLGVGGAGVVIFETGRLFGGDPDYIYLGEYKVTPDGKKNQRRAGHFQLLGPSNFDFRAGATLQTSHRR
jgi:hypothetical protein